MFEVQFKASVFLILLVYAYLYCSLLLMSISVCVCAKWLQWCPTLCTPWTVALQALLSMGFSRQEYWSGLPFPSPQGLPEPGIEPASLTSPALAGRFFTTSATWEAHKSPSALSYCYYHSIG